jgi:hypothetical protein
MNYVSTCKFIYGRKGWHEHEPEVETRQITYEKFLSKRAESKRESFITCISTSDLEGTSRSSISIDLMCSHARSYHCCTIVG